LGDEGNRALADRLIAWLQTPEWAASEAFIREHAAELLSDAGTAAMTLLHMHNAGDETVEMHARLLTACRAQGIDAAYAQVRRELSAAEGLMEAAGTAAESPLLQAIAEFVTAATDDDARRVLEEHRDLLLTTQARRLREQLAAVAQGQGDAAVTERLQARLALWDQVWRGRVGGPLRPREQEPRQEQPERFDRLERQPLAGERGAKYTVITAVNCAIGDNATTLNIYDVGALPLAWSRPRETRPDLAAIAVGRATDLEELHRRLQAGGDVALVGVRGIAGIGKTVLAAMYATRYADHFPGGVIWVNVGPQVRTRDDVTPLLQRLAAYAYNRDVHIAWLDEIVFAPDAVQMLLGNHGRLLLVFDDVWTAEVIQTLRAVAPPGSAVLVTTRDRRVAYALGGPEAIQELDQLTPQDARALLQKRAPGLPDDLADRVAKGLGYHAQALSLAGAALYLRKPHHYAATAEEILQRVANGAGFGDLPYLDQADQPTDVEIALKYTYDYLGEDPQHGTQWQACFRALGAFAQEADFDTAAAAALWQMPTAQAEALLSLFDRLALVQEQAGGGRWQQHAILRAYALSLQDDRERLLLPERHAGHYLELARASIPADTDRVAREFPQIEHALTWCRQYSPGLATRLATLVSQVMMIRGRAVQAGEWLRASLDAANRTGDRSGKANTLQSLGDLESRLGNVDYETFRQTSHIQADPLALALAALLQAGDDAAFARALADHPILREADALFALDGLLNQALQTRQNQAVVRLTVLLVALLDGYNWAHVEQINLEAHTAVIDLCARLIPLAEQLHADLAAALRQQAGWACNTLGNHDADMAKDREQAVAAYTRGLGFDPGNAMLLRNRAGIHLDRRDWAAARADIAAAAVLEPDAPRLIELRAALAAGEGGEGG